MRTQDITRLPAARFHFMNDVMEAGGRLHGGGEQLEHHAVRNGYGLYPKPHLSHNGSRQRFNAQAVWYFGDSDHQSFLDAGVPAITFTNNPDQYIHSNLDDLFQIDRTQLGRNALTAALIALYHGVGRRALVRQARGGSRRTRTGTAWAGASASHCKLLDAASRSPRRVRRGARSGSLRRRS